MLNSMFIRYYINEWNKLIKHPQLRILWFLFFITPICLAVFLGQVQIFNSLGGTLTALRTKLTMFYLGIQMTVLPISILTFFISLQIEYRNQTFLWPVVRTIDELYWIWSKWLSIFTIYVALLTLSLMSSIFWIQYNNTFENINNRIVQRWFWELGFHFIFLPIPAFLTVYLVGLLVHRYAIALLVVIGLTYAIELRYNLFAPFFALRYSINLNMLLLSGTSLWTYSDLSKYYIIAICYSSTIVIIIRYLIAKRGIYKLFNT